MVAVPGATVADTNSQYAALVRVHSTTVSVDIKGALPTVDKKVQVDGKDLDVSNYTVKEGSTIVTLKAEYLETLSVGKHTLAIVSETGTATTEFTVKAAAVTDDTQSPQTGDDSNIALWIGVLLAAGAALTGTAVYSRKRKYSK